MQNRTYKFRAWDKKLSKMFIPNQMDAHGTIVVDMRHEDSSGFGTHPEEYPNPYELMQYTGLKDRHGKEIYEGDVVKHRKLDEAADSIKYGLGMCLENEPQIVEYTHCGFHPLAGWIDKANKELDWEVLGNIYENPELMK